MHGLPGAHGDGGGDGAVLAQAFLADVIARIVACHPQSQMTTSCPGPTPLHPSRPWPGHGGYVCVRLRKARRPLGPTLP